MTILLLIWAALPLGFTQQINIVSKIDFYRYGQFAALKYIDKRGRTRHYTPDFYLPVENKYIEVKGRFTEKAKRNMMII
jgi:hypothetical protein